MIYKKTQFWGRIYTPGSCLKEFQNGLNSALQVPYLVGEIFVLEAPDVVQTMLEKRKYVQCKQNGLKERKEYQPANMTHFQFYFIIEIRADTENEVTALENRAAGIKVWH